MLSRKNGNVLRRSSTRATEAISSIAKAEVPSWAV